ncbi:MAG TPA: 3-hydroxyacyl-CoA dehydrogenase NAD-binding domain-containing protein, partial [Thermoanaerobaculia bacterium]
MAEIRKVGILGCGLMGSGIAQVAAQGGFDTIVREVEQKFVDKGFGSIEKSLGKFVEKGKLSAGDRDAAMGRLKGTTALEDLADCDIVIEAIIENVQLKKETYAALDAIV